MALEGQYQGKHYFLSRVLRDSTPCFVGPTFVRHATSSVCGLWPHCSCLNDQVTSNTAPAHLHATGVAVYLALLISDVHPTNSGNWSNLSHLTCNATLAPSLSLFLLVIVVVLLHHRRRSSPTLFDTRHPSSQQLGSGSTLFFFIRTSFFQGCIKLSIPPPHRGGGKPNFKTP